MADRRSFQHHRREFLLYVDKKLKRRILIYIILAAIILGIALYEAWIAQYFWWYIVGLWGGAVMLGVLFARIFHIRWDEDQELITSKIDRVGIVVLVFYILFAFSRRFIIQEFIHGHAKFIAIYMALASGVMFGRFVGIYRSIRKLLHQKTL